MNLHDRPITVFEYAQATSGYGGGDLRATELRTIRNCRMSANAPAIIRTKPQVKLTSGLVDRSATSATLRDRSKPASKQVRTARRRFRNNPANVGRLAR